ncbi:MAG: hypothetical protein KMY55_15720 [Dethiosulfatibacter sp.]|nr:hypothetical protein [Dethiosulfatibacter sp.]
MRKRVNDWDLVTPAEAIELSEQRPIGDTFKAEEIAKKVMNDAVNNGERDFRWVQLKLLATVWNAGRVAGIRSERMKRRRGIS